MIRNYIKVAVRNILRSKLTSFINVAGLALAMASAMMIYLFVQDELSYDRYNAKSDRMYRITRDFFSDDGSVNLRLCNIAPPIGPLMKNDFGEVEVMGRTVNFPFVISLEENGELKKAIAERRTYFAEPDIFKIFDITILVGKTATSLEQPFTVMLSEKTAVKFFGELNVVGKRLRAGNRLDLEVTGVYQSLPLESHWHPDLMISFSTLKDSGLYDRVDLETNWGINAFSTYFLLESGADPQKMQALLPAFLNKHFKPNDIANRGASANLVASKVTTLHVQKVTDIHLRSHLDDELEAGGNLNNVYMISVIGVFIVLIACFNFVNLATARSAKRSKEVGLRKVVGAVKSQLIIQYLSESIVIATLGFVFAIGLSLMALPWLNAFTQKNLTFDFVSQWRLLLGLIAFALAVGLLAGIYPAFVISGFKPALVLKGQGAAKARGTLRKTLVAAQFVISIVLIIATMITTQQLGYLNSRPLGYNRDQVITLPFFRELRPNYEAFYNELTKNSAIVNATLSSRVPTGRLLDSYGNAIVIEGDSLVNSQVNFKSVAVDEDFIETYGISIAAGRNFSKTILTDDSLAFMINETGANALGWKNYSSKINSDFQYAGVNGKLIGVVKDFHFESLHQPISPMIFLISRRNFDWFSVRLSGSDMQAGLTHLGKLWKEFLPKRPFDFQFISDNYQHLYEAELKENQLLTIFSSLAIFIACLGLLGLATFNTLQRIKEIGIRKVLGASVPSILALLSSEILMLMIIASVIACPVAWYFMSKWLTSFAYHIEMSLIVYLSATLLAMFVALITIGSQTLKAAMRNPSETLRYE